MSVRSKLDCQEITVSDLIHAHGRSLLNSNNQNRCVHELLFSLSFAPAADEASQMVNFTFCVNITIIALSCFNKYSAHLRRDLKASHSIVLDWGHLTTSIFSLQLIERLPT